MGKMIKVKIKKWGNSYGIVIPKEVMKDENLKNNEEIEILIVKDSKKRFDELFGSLKRELNKSTEQIMREIDRDLYPEDYKDD